MDKTLLTLKSTFIIHYSLFLPIDFNTFFTRNCHSSDIAVDSERGIVPRMENRPVVLDSSPFRSRVSSRSRGPDEAFRFRRTRSACSSERGNLSIRLRLIACPTTASTPDIDILAVPIAHIAGLSERRVFWMLAAIDRETGPQPVPCKPARRLERSHDRAVHRGCRMQQKSSALPHQQARPTFQRAPVSRIITASGLVQRLRRLALLHWQSQ